MARRLKRRRRARMTAPPSARPGGPMTGYIVGGVAVLLVLYLIATYNRLVR